MSDSRQAFEAWAEDKSFTLLVSSGAGYISVKEMAWEAWQAAQAPQPVVDQQLLNDIMNMLVAVKGAIKLGRDADACNYINAAIAAAQENNK